MLDGVPSDRAANPVTFAFLILPFGISNGFVAVTLPFALTQAGFSVAGAGAVVALALSANVWRFALGPVVDMTLTLHRWYLIGLVACVATLVLLGVMPLRTDAAVALTIAAFVSQVGACLLSAPVGGFMAHAVEDDEKGRAAGWYQAGNLGGTGIGGGAGVWLVSQFSVSAAAIALAASMLSSAVALRFVRDVAPIPHQRITIRLRLMGRDLLDLLRSPVGLLTIILLLSPIGAGAMNNLWSAVAPDWNADANTVAVVTGVLNGVLSAVGCVFGGWIADRFGRWWAYFGSGVLIALAAFAMALAARSAGAFAGGVLAYSLMCGFAYAAFSALVLFAIGRGAASTKYALLSSIGNVPVIYMTAFNGYMHDRFGAGGMLLMEAGVSVVAIALAAGAVWWLKRQRVLVPPAAA